MKMFKKATLVRLQAKHKTFVFSDSMDQLAIGDIGEVVWTQSSVKSSQTIFCWWPRINALCPARPENIVKI